MQQVLFNEKEKELKEETMEVLSVKSFEEKKKATLESIKPISFEVELKKSVIIGANGIEEVEVSANESEEQVEALEVQEVEAMESENIEITEATQEEQMEQVETVAETAEAQEAEKQEAKPEAISTQAIKKFKEIIESEQAKVETEEEKNAILEMNLMVLLNRVKKATNNELKIEKLNQWLWASGKKTKEYKEVLKAYGFRFSKSNQKWYFTINETKKYYRATSWDYKQKHYNPNYKATNAVKEDKTTEKETTPAKTTQQKQKTKKESFINQSIEDRINAFFK